MTIENKARSLAATCAALCGLAALGLIVIGLLSALSGLLAPLTGFGLFGLGVTLVPALGLLLGLVGLLRTRADTRLGRERAWFGLATGGVILIAFVLLFLPAAGMPPIHDITTSPDRPPEYAGPASEGRDVDYPHGGAGVTQQQLEGYPDLAPIELAVAADSAYERALAAASDIGLEILYENPNDRHFEATATSRLFRFVDDFVVEVEGGTSGGGSVVHVRSTSRVGQSDLGANAARIDRFASRLQP
jgi:uncharacterized protein (DUF1499 family)